MLPFKLFYSDAYDLNLGQHVFQAQKYRLIHDRLLRERFADPADFVEPESATDEDVLLVHDPAWVDKLRHGTLSFHEILKLEIPYSRKAVEACWLMAGGTIQAADDTAGTGAATVVTFATQDTEGGSDVKYFVTSQRYVRFLGTVQSAKDMEMAVVVEGVARDTSI